MAEESNENESRFQKKKKVLKISSLEDLDTAPAVPVEEVGIDFALGGGFYLNTFIEIFGQYQSGKTTLCFEVAKAFLRAFPSKQVRYYNYERSIDKFYVRRLMGNDEALIKRFIIVQPDFMEEGLNDILEVMTAQTTSFIIVDSLAAMETKPAIEKQLGETAKVAEKAKLMAEFCRKVGQKIGESNLSLCFINHENELLETGSFSFVKKTTTPGGDSLKFWASLRIQCKIIGRMTKTEKIPGGKADGDQVPYGNVVQVLISKNKYFPPFKRSVCYIIYGQGFDRARTLIDYGQLLGLIGKKGKTDYYITGREDRTVKGVQNFADRINEKPDVYNFLHSQISKALIDKKDEIQGTSESNVDTGEAIDQNQI